MSGEVDCTTGRADWARGIRGCLIWGIPIAILLMSPGMGTRYLVIVWPGLLTFMGVTCLLNARHCGRIHCYFTGPFFLVLAGAAQHAAEHPAESCVRQNAQASTLPARGPGCMAGMGDITWLPTTVRGVYLRLYLVMDVWSRRIVGWRIAETESADIAAQLTQACREGHLDPRGLVLHSDNGKPMRASTLIATLQWLGVVPSFSRPHVSDDNPYSEALFRTLKHTPAYPHLPCASLDFARQWVVRFVAWYNGEHRHSAIRYVTPDERHSGLEHDILAKRHRLYQQARRSAPKRWTRSTRNWTPIGSVVLNPQGSSEPVCA